MEYSRGSEPFFQGPADAGLTNALVSTGTVFAGSSFDGVGPIPGAPQYVIADITLDAGDIVANGTLVTFLVDTAGFTSGTYALRMKDFIGTNALLATSLTGTSGPVSGVTISNGTINIIPEPASIVMILLGGVFLVTRRRTVPNEIV